MCPSQNILEVDCGNTRTKWRLTSENDVLARGSELSSDFPGQLLLEVSTVDQIRLCSVRSKIQTSLIVDRLMAAYGCDVKLARVTRECAGVKNGYDLPESLGVDRWLAILGAYTAFKCACLIIDAGTAVTIEEVDSSGSFRGGIILPGYFLMSKVLLKETGRVRFDALARLTDRNTLGRNTADAVAGGIALAIGAACNCAAERFLTSYPDGIICVTGGDGSEIVRMMPVPVVHCPDLVLDGLSVALP